MTAHGLKPDEVNHVRAAAMKSLTQGDKALTPIERGILDWYQKIDPNADVYLKGLKEHLWATKTTNQAFHNYEALVGEQEARLTELLRDFSQGKLAKSYPLNKMAYDPQRQYLQPNYFAAPPIKKVSEYFKDDPRYLRDLEEQARTGSPPRWGDRLKSTGDRIDQTDAVIVKE
jgi:hypothetical protein